MNVTEDPIDHTPAHADDLNTIKALQTLHHKLDLQDLWRHCFPHDCSFTYRANHQIKAHLDRTYTSNTVAKHTFGWATCQTTIPTDHWMVLTKYAPANTPFIRKGRWTWQISSLEDKKLIKKVIQLQRQLTRLLSNNVAHETSNPQSLWKSFKDDIKETATKHNKTSRSKINKQINLIRKDMEELTNHPNLDEDESVRYNEAFLANKLAHLKKARAKRLQRRIESNTSIPGGNPGWDMVSNKQRKEAQRHPLSPKDP